MGRDIDPADPPEIVRHILKAQGLAEAVEDEDHGSGGAYPALVLSKMLANATLELARAVARLDQDQVDLSDLLDSYMEGTNEDIAELAQLADAAKEDAATAWDKACAVEDRMDQLESRLRKVEKRLRFFDGPAAAGEDGTGQLVSPKCYGCGAFLPEAEAGDTHTADGCGGKVGLFPVTWPPLSADEHEARGVTP